MRALRAAAAVTIGAGLLTWGPLAPPASAAVTASTSGTTLTVDVTGEETITFGCVSTRVAVNGVQATPLLACTALTQVTVTGDSAAQTVYGAALDAFAAAPRLVADLGDGADYLEETDRNDQIAMGPGADRVQLHAGGQANASVDLGTGTGDRTAVRGTPGADTMVAASTNSTAIVTTTSASGVSTSASTGSESLTIESLAGNDSIDTTGISAASSIASKDLYGGDGNDVLTDGPTNAQLHGGAGTNALTGGDGADSYWSEGDGDTLAGGSDAQPEFIYDTLSLRSGGRTLGGFTSIDTHITQTHQGDVAMRVRPDASGVRVTSSLTRPGQQLVPSSIGTVSLGQSFVGSVPRRGIADIVVGPTPTRATLSSTGGGILDVTVPSGSWTTTVGGGGANITVESAAGAADATFVTDHRVHGPWTDKRQGFAHRVTRDLLFRFATDAVRDQIRDQLASGTRTRPQVTASIMGTDEYRGLDVDRVFVKYLRRVSDPGGRTYWINSIRNGKALWRFRAQLFGSNEYFSKAGATNASYVTKAYNDVLGRNPDPSGQAYWTNKLNNGADRGSVALQFMNSPEARRRLVDDQFLRFLDRLPTATEQSTWVARIPSATGEQDLIAFLANSSAYFNRS